MTTPELHPTWYASLHSENADEKQARALAVWLRCSDTTTLRTLGDVVDHLNKLERRNKLMELVLSTYRARDDALRPAGGAR